MTYAQKLAAMQKAIRCARDLVELLDCEDGTINSGFTSRKLRDMYYELNHMSVTLTEMREELEEN